MRNLLQTAESEAVSTGVPSDLRRRSCDGVWRLVLSVMGVKTDAFSPIVSWLSTSDAICCSRDAQ